MLPVRIGAGPLPSGLQNLERQTGIELLYDSDLVRGLQSPAVSGNLTSEAALRQLLAETNLTIRRAASGAWIVERQATAPLAQQDAAVSEILVVGRRTQNADIRRSENDVIDLRGLGSESTLVLVDGRRMPGIPVSVTGFRQADLNTIPLRAIERIEILTGAD